MIPENLTLIITLQVRVPTNALLAKQKVKLEYVGPVDSDAAQEVETNVRRRKVLEEKLGQVKENLADVEQGLRGKR